MLLWLPEITIDRGHSPKAHSPKADSDTDTCIFNTLYLSASTILSAYMKVQGPQPLHLQ